MTVSAANMCMTIFIVIMQVSISVANYVGDISALHYAHDFFYCNSTVDCFCYSYVGDSFK